MADQAGIQRYQHSGIQRYRRKPETVKPRDTDLTMTRYQPGEPLDDLWVVARMANQHAELTEAELPGGRVLLVKYANLRGDDPDTEFVVVRPNAFLAFNHAHGDLDENDVSNLRGWYDLVEEG
jgi:hypothetical protein